MNFLNKWCACWQHRAMHVQRYCRDGQSFPSPENILYYFMICLNNFCRIDVARPNKKTKCNSKSGPWAPLIQKIRYISSWWNIIDRRVCSVSQHCSVQLPVTRACGSVCVYGCTLLFHAHGPLNITLRFLIWPSDILRQKLFQHIIK